VVYQDVASRDFQAKLDHGRPTGRHQRRLHVSERRCFQRRLVINPVKNLTDDVERRGKVGPSDAKEDPYGLPDLCLQRLLLGECPPPHR
jgi:hypothetical protein